jgi:hypothetical protein
MLQIAMDRIRLGSAQTPDLGQLRIDWVCLELTSRSARLLTGQRIIIYLRPVEGGFSRPRFMREWPSRASWVEFGSVTWPARLLDQLTLSEYEYGFLESFRLAWYGLMVS